jgi:hypothetical protein
MLSDRSPADKEKLLVMLGNSAGPSWRQAKAAVVAELAKLCQEAKEGQLDPP